MEPKVLEAYVLQLSQNRIQLEAALIQAQQKIADLEKQLQERADKADSPQQS